MSLTDFQYFTCNIPACGFITRDLHKFLEHCAEDNFYFKYFKKTPIVHDQVEDFKCRDCRFADKNYEDFRKHVEEKHNGRMKNDHRTQLVCRRCLFATKEMQLFIQHCAKYEHSQKGDFQCKDCAFKTRSFNAYERHVRLEHRESKAFSCDYCTMKFSSHETFSTHMTLEHDIEKNMVTTVKCPICMKEFSKYRLKSKLKCHIQKAHADIADVHACDICGFEYKDKRTLTNHIKQVHLGLEVIYERKHKCEVCDYKAATSTRLKDHVQAVHIRVKKFSCDLCEFKAATKRAVSNHFSTTHGKKEFECEICGMKFRMKLFLRRHQENIHVKNRNINCNLCDFKTTQASNLTSHMKQRHSNEKGFKCDQCGRAFKVKMPLERHIRLVHEKDKCKEHKCDNCDFSTLHESSMKRHKISFHDNTVGMKSELNCPICNIVLKSKAGLKMHMKRIHEGKSLNCSSCDYSTNIKTDLFKHMKNKHEL